MLEFLEQRGGEDTIDKPVYSLRASGQAKAAEAFLREPQKPGRWSEARVGNRRKSENDVLVRSGETERALLPLLSIFIKVESESWARDIPIMCLLPDESALSYRRWQATCPEERNTDLGERSRDPLDRLETRFLLRIRR